MMRDSHPRSPYTSQRSPENDVENMKAEQLIDLFKDTHSSRMEVCKAAERIVREKQHLSEQVFLHSVSQR